MGLWQPISLCHSSGQQMAFHVVHGEHDWATDALAEGCRRRCLFSSGRWQLIRANQAMSNTSFDGTWHMQQAGNLLLHGRLQCPENRIVTHDICSRTVTGECAVAVAMTS